MKNIWKNLALFICSLVFYAWGEPIYIVLLLVSIAANYGIGLLLGCQRDESVAAKTVLAAGILVNLGILGYYKYFDFFLRIVNRLTGSEHEMRNIPLPIGISFFTFGAISYLMDLYRGHYEAEKNPLNMALYLSFFPKISVGPIARYRDFAPQLTNRQETVEKTAEGIRRFAYGLGKKVLVANIVGASVDKIYAQDITNVTGVMVWCAAILYAIQIYYDFSGYSDMAIGLGRMFGFHFLENFDYPYVSRSITEFWRRWHISLSAWFRDYVYFPLGGSRVDSRAKHIRNLFVVWLLTGVWHGANWTFLVWGGLHGLCQVAEDHMPAPLRKRKSLPLRIVGVPLTFAIFVTTFTIFRTSSLGNAAAYFAGILHNPGHEVFAQYWLLGLTSKLELLLLLLGIALLVLVDVLHECGLHLRAWVNAAPRPVRWAVYEFAIFAFLLMASFYSNTGFLYARF